jgi:hypothetical protein
VRLLRQIVRELPALRLPGVAAALLRAFTDRSSADSGAAAGRSWTRS